MFWKHDLFCDPSFTDTLYAIGTGNGYVLLRNLAGETVKTIPLGRTTSDTIRTLRFAHESQWIIVGGDHGILRIWDRHDQSIKRELKVHLLLYREHGAILGMMII
jgi:WD40 repeat protein